MSTLTLSEYNWWMGLTMTLMWLLRLRLSLVSRSGPPFLIRNFILSIIRKEKNNFYYLSWRSFFFFRKLTWHSLIKLWSWTLTINLVILLDIVLRKLRFFSIFCLLWRMMSHWKALYRLTFILSSTFSSWTLIDWILLVKICSSFYFCSTKNWSRASVLTARTFFFR